MSTDGTLDIIKKYHNKPLSIVIVHNPNKIVSTGFNLGLNHAKGDVIVRIDGHATIPENYLRDCISLLEKHETDIVGGIIETVSTGLVGKAISLAQTSLFGVGLVKFRGVGKITSGFVDSLAFGAHKRKLFSDFGGYDEEMKCNQDDEFNFRVINAGKKIWMDVNLVTKYFSRSSYLGLFKQYFNYGYFKVRGIQKRGSIFSVRSLVPSLFVVGLFVTFFLSYSYNQPLFSLSIIIPYILANLFFSIRQLTSIKLMPLIFFAYWVLHLAYGLGFIYGLVCFVGKWHDTELRDYHFNRKHFNSVTIDNA